MLSILYVGYSLHCMCSPYFIYSSVYIYIYFFFTFMWNKLTVRISCCQGIRRGPSYQSLVWCTSTPSKQKSVHNSELWFPFSAYWTKWIHLPSSTNHGTVCVCLGAASARIHRLYMHDGDDNDDDDDDDDENNTNYDNNNNNNLKKKKIDISNKKKQMHILYQI